MKSLTKVFFAVLLAVTFAFGSFQLYANARTMADVDGEVTKAQSHPLLGTWSNQLGSKMTIESVSADVEVKGSYETAVSSVNCPKGLELPLVGRIGENPDPVIGFVVSWPKKCSSVTAWSGQLQGDKIVTTWLLRNQVSPEPKYNWNSTLVNQDIFTKDNSKPST